MSTEFSDDESITQQQQQQQQQIRNRNYRDFRKRGRSTARSKVLRRRQPSRHRASDVALSNLTIFLTKLSAHLTDAPITKCCETDSVQVPRR